MRNYKETLEWYEKHQTTSQIGFNPNGMCLRVCRTARDISAVYPSAVASQNATPREHRVYRVEDLRKGMVIYYDDPNDSNTFGHIVTMVGRVKNFNRHRLSDILVETNSVKSGELVVVRGDYFPEHWGDKFQFGATWLNGRTLDIPSGKSKIGEFHEEGNPFELDFLEAAAENGRPAAKKALMRIRYEVYRLPRDHRLPSVEQFIESYVKDNVLRMGLLKTAVDRGATGLVKQVRDNIKTTIDGLPDR